MYLLYIKINAITFVRNFLRENFCEGKIEKN